VKCLRVAALIVAMLVLCAGHAYVQVPAPYQLFVRHDCELKSEYSAETRTTTVQLTLMPPGLDSSPSAASLRQATCGAAAVRVGTWRSCPERQADAV
jgi:hypothetical protein